MLDPELCAHLEESYVQAQLYGLRWARLLLGREFTVRDAQVFRIWDFLFACCHEAENYPPDALLDEDTPPNIYSVLASARIAGYTRHSNIERRRQAAERMQTDLQQLQLQQMGGDRDGAWHQDVTAPRRGELPAELYRSLPAYVCTPLLGALADCMLAMLLHIREELVQADASFVMGHLMRYPQQETITPVIDLADMIRR